MLTSTCLMCVALDCSAFRKSLGADAAITDLEEIYTDADPCFSALLLQMDLLAVQRNVLQK